MKKMDLGLLEEIPINLQVSRHQQDSFVEVDSVIYSKPHFLGTLERHKKYRQDRKLFLK